MRTRRCAALLGAVMLAVAPAGASAATREVVVLTSFPKELFEEYKKAFERHHPGVTVAVKQQQTNQGVTYLRETRARHGGGPGPAGSGMGPTG